MPLNCSNLRKSGTIFATASARESNDFLNPVSTARKDHSETRSLQDDADLFALVALDLYIAVLNRAADSAALLDPLGKSLLLFHGNPLPPRNHGNSLASPARLFAANIQTSA